LQLFLNPHSRWSEWLYTLLVSFVLYFYLSAKLVSLIFIPIFIILIILGIKILQLNNPARLTFIILQIPIAVIHLYYFVMTFIISCGLIFYNGPSYIEVFGPNVTNRRIPVPPLAKWPEILHILISAIPLLLFLFYIVFLTRPKVKEQFR
jgi:hypothetical protein